MLAPSCSQTEFQGGRLLQRTIVSLIHGARTCASGREVAWLLQVPSRLGLEWLLESVLQGLQPQVGQLHGHMPQQRLQLEGQGSSIWGEGCSWGHGSGGCQPPAAAAASLLLLLVVVALLAVVL